jgi:phosphopantetheinyl transferase (holo-ACP synthase)
MATLSFLSNEEILKIQKLLNIPHLEILLKKEWGSQAPDYRESLHSELKKKMAHAYPLSDSSISHCHSMGGFAFAQYDVNHIFQIGIDVEEISRVKTETARRVCGSDEEFQMAPSSASLWTAKEAAYKSLKGPNQPQAMSELELIQWHTVDSQTETVALKNPKKYFFNSTVGVVTKKEAYSLAFFICRP